MRTMLRRIARPFLKPIWHLYWRLRAPRLDHNPHVLAAPYIVVGLFSAASGLGQSARLSYQALQDTGHDVHAIDLAPAFGQSEMTLDQSLRDGLAVKGKGTLIFYINAPEMPRALAMLGQHFITDKYVVGYWAWELPQLPAVWRAHITYAHEVWTCSRFSQQALQRSGVQKVKIVYNPIQPYQGAGLLPDDINIPADVHVTLVMANADSSLARKNPYDAIAAFKKAFGHDPHKILILHIVRLGMHPRERVKIIQAIADTPTIKLIERPLSSDARYALIRRADIVLSLHRAEGYGMVMAEAMLEAKPVIATGWSGNLDFMNHDGAALVPFTLVPADDPSGIYDSKNQMWAQADVEAAAAWLRRLADNPQEAEAMGQKAAAYIKATLNPEHYARQACLG